MHVVILAVIRVLQDAESVLAYTEAIRSIVLLANHFNLSTEVIFINITIIFINYAIKAPGVIHCLCDVIRRSAEHRNEAIDCILKVLPSVSSADLRKSHWVTVAKVGFSLMWPQI